MLALRVRELTAFQDQACADEYAGFVERVRAREAAVTGGEALARAVAENLYKLTAYKDEYEVARLSLDPALDEAVRAQFGDGARYQYRLHPPVLRALGLKHKVSLGPWFRPAFATLVAMRRLRGTRLDPFGRTEVRRTERALITEYREVIEQLLAGLTEGNHDLAVQIAALPDMVRGYEDIKLANRPRLPREAGRTPRGVRRVNASALVPSRHNGRSRLAQCAVTGRVVDAEGDRCRVEQRGAQAGLAAFRDEVAEDGLDFDRPAFAAGRGTARR